MKKTNLSIFVFIIFFSTQIVAQLDSVVATFGNETITLGELKERYELMPHLGSKNQNNDTSKFNFLYSMIAEKLWAAEAIDKGIDQIEIIRYSMMPLEKIYVRDALFKKEVESRLEITNNVLEEARIKAKYKISANIISSNDSVALTKFYLTLTKNNNFDSLVSKLDKRFFVIVKKEIRFGDLDDESLEDIVYSLPIDGYSIPIYTRGGSFVFHVTNKTILSQEEANSKLQNKRTLKEIVRDRRSKKAGTAYLAGLLKGQTAKFNDRILENLDSKIFNALLEKRKNATGKDTLDTYLDETSVIRILNSFSPDTLNMQVVSFEKGGLTLREFLYTLIFDSFAMKKIEIEKVKQNVNRKIKFFSEQELITREGYRQGLQNSPEVSKDLKLWKENMVAQYARNQFFDTISVSESTLYNYLLQLNSEYNVVVLEIFSTKLDDIEKSLLEIAKGTDFREVVRMFSEKKEQPSMLSDTSFVPISYFGKMQSTINQLHLLEVYGPMPHDGGFSLFKLIDKKIVDKNYHRTFEEVKGELLNQYRFDKLDSLYSNHTTKLALKYGVKINEPVVKKSLFSDINMFTQRYMGFGGRLTASPYITPWYNWYKQFKTIQKANP